MILGYARCSSLEPESDLEEQRRVLAGFGAVKVFVERGGTPTGPRPVLAQCLGVAREGDTVAIARPDQICGSPLRLLEIETGLRKRAACGCWWVASLGSIWTPAIPH